MYDVVIIGLGCAAYTAAVYTARYKLSTLIVGAEEGGMGMTATEVGNWPGIIEIGGPELMENFKKHALSFESVEHRNALVTKVEQTNGDKVGPPLPQGSGGGEGGGGGGRGGGKI